MRLLLICGISILILFHSPNRTEQANLQQTELMNFEISGQNTDSCIHNSSLIKRKLSLIHFSIDSNICYNLRSLKSLSFLNIPVPVFEYYYGNATIRSYKELEKELEKWHAINKFGILSTSASSNEIPYQLYQNDSLWNAKPKQYSLPAIDFNELTLISFTNVKKSGCILKINHEVKPDLENCSLTITEQHFKKKDCWEALGLAIPQLNWFLVPKMPPSFTIKWKFKNEMN